MNYRICVMLLILSGCVAQIPTQFVIKEQCSKGVFEIKQIVDDGFLLSKCTYLFSDGTLHCFGLDVFFEINTHIKPWSEYGEGMYIVTPGETTCLVKNGTYKYINGLDRERTVVKLKLSDSKVINPEYEKWQAEQISKNKKDK